MIKGNSIVHEFVDCWIELLRACRKSKKANDGRKGEKTFHMDIEPLY